MTYCDLHCIKRDKLFEVLNFYSSFANSFSNNLTLTYNLRHRMIFRKLTDVQHERKLAQNGTNNAAQLELPSEHSIRNFISRIRKVGDNSNKDKVIVCKSALEEKTSKKPTNSNMNQKNVTYLEKVLKPEMKDVSMTSETKSYRNVKSCNHNLDHVVGSISNSNSTLNVAIVNTLRLIRVELKNEILTLSDNMNRLDGQINHLLNFLHALKLAKSSHQHLKASVESLGSLSSYLSPQSISINADVDTDVMMEQSSSSLWSKHSVDEPSVDFSNNTFSSAMPLSNKEVRDHLNNLDLL